RGARPRRGEPGAPRRGGRLLAVPADLERWVEIPFPPAPAARTVEATDFCIAGPQTTPHVVAQQLLPPGDRRTIELRLEPGRYRLRALALAGSLPVAVGPEGAPPADAGPGAGGRPAGEPLLGPEARLRPADRTAAEE